MQVSCHKSQPADSKQIYAESSFTGVDEGGLSVKIADTSQSRFT
jgi:hypothetical protein